MYINAQINKIFGVWHTYRNKGSNMWKKYIISNENNRFPKRMIHKRKDRKHVLNINFPLKISKTIVMNKFAKNFVILILVNYAHLCFILEFHNHM